MRTYILERHKVFLFRKIYTLEIIHYSDLKDGEDRISRSRNLTVFEPKTKAWEGITDRLGCYHWSQGFSVTIPRVWTDTSGIIRTKLPPAMGWPLGKQAWKHTEDTAEEQTYTACGRGAPTLLQNASHSFLHSPSKIHLAEITLVACE